MAAMAQIATISRSVSAPNAAWDEEVVSDLLALTYVRAVVFTNGQGRTLRLNRRATVPDGLAKIADLALAQLTQTGAALELGKLEVSACVYENGIMLLAGSSSLRVAVLADNGANLGSLLNNVKRIFRERQA